MSSTFPTDRGLRSLPPEIRLLIFKFVLRDTWKQFPALPHESDGFDAFEYQEKIDEVRRIPALVKALRPDELLYKEALEAFNRVNTFSLDETNNWSWTNMSESTIQSIESLSLFILPQMSECWMTSNNLSDCGCPDCYNSLLNPPSLAFELTDELYAFTKLRVLTIDIRHAHCFSWGEYGPLKPDVKEWGDLKGDARWGPSFEFFFLSKIITGTRKMAFALPILREIHVHTVHGFRGHKSDGFKELSMFITEMNESLGTIAEVEMVGILKKPPIIFKEQSTWTWRLR